jgi:ABC-type Fe3+-siderophore transport system permease subunit
MSMRKITSLTATLSFVLTVTTSIILYIVPQGRVAYWSDWRMWGLTKTQWGDVHINVGLLFLLALFLHIYYNWKPLMAYLKDRSKRMVFFTPAFNVALAVIVLTVYRHPFHGAALLLGAGCEYRDQGCRGKEIR